MKESELVKRLEGVGLKPPEAAAFRALSRLGPSRAAEVALAADLSRAVAYDALEALEARGVVQRTLERPAKYVALAMGEALARVVAEREEELAQLRREAALLAADWPEQATAEAAKERVAVVQTPAQVRGLLHRLIGAARDEVMVVVPRRGLARLDGLGVLDALAACAAEGAFVRVLTEIDADSLALGARLAKDGEVRHSSIPGYRHVVVVDGEHVVLFVTPEVSMATGAGRETVLHVRAAEAALGQKAVFDLLWERGVPFAERALELETGQPAAQVLAVRGRWMRYTKSLEMLDRAQHDVVLLTTHVDLNRLERAGLLAQLRRLRRQRVTVRLAVSGAFDARDALWADLGVARGAWSFPGAVLLVDGQEALLTLGCDEAPEAVAHEGEWSVWALLPGHLGWLVEALRHGKDP